MNSSTSGYKGIMSPSAATARPPLRVGIVMPLASQQGGAEALFDHLLHQRSERLQYVIAFLEEGPFVETARSLGYETSVFPTTRLSSLSNLLVTVRTIRRWVRDKQLTIVFSWMLKAHFYVAPAAVFTGVRTGWFQHGISINPTMDRLATLLPAKAIFCCSDHACTAQNRLPPHRRTWTCYPGVPSPSAEPLESHVAREKLGLPAHHKIVGMVARWERWKGPHIFVDAAKILIEANPRVTCFLVGGAHPLDIKYATELQAHVEMSGMGTRFLLVGQRPSSEIPVWHAAADLIVHPVTSPEPFGMAIVEAMGNGRAVIASALGGPKEIIEDGVSGVLVEPGDIHLLADTIQELLGDPERCARIGFAARFRAQSFSVEAFVRRFEELLLTTFAANNQSGAGYSITDRSTDCAGTAND